MARYEKGHKEETRARVVEAAAARFRTDGIDGVGVATLMGDAGLTRGGFYAHFASKEALVKQATLQACGAWSALPGTDGSVLDLRAFIEGYLGPAHRDRPAIGCPLAALAPDLARRPRDTRVAIARAMRSMVGRIAAALPDGTRDEAARLARANAIVAQMVGSLQIARIVVTRAESEAILAAGRDAALVLAGLSPR